MVHFIPNLKVGVFVTLRAPDVIKEDVKGMREDIQPGYATNFRQVQADVKAIKERLGMS